MCLRVSGRLIAMTACLVHCFLTYLGHGYLRVEDRHTKNECLPLQFFGLHFKHPRPKLVRKPPYP